MKAVRPTLALLGLASLLAAAPAPSIAAPSIAAPAPSRRAPAVPVAPETGIAAVVNGDVISQSDVVNRGRLFAVSTGLPLTPEVLDRLRAQMAKQLIDERLRLQEAQRRHVIITDSQIADAIHEIETRNGMPAGALRAKLTADGVSFRTLVDQIRVQLSWTQVLRQQLGETGGITPSEVDEQMKALKQETGKTEYRVGEIFIPVDEASSSADAQRFAETVITELRSGAPFPVAAAQFSQSQTALQGGDEGWLQSNQMDAAVARVAQEMPIGAISNPIRVPGGISIVTLRAKREIGHDVGTIINARQVFFPFATPLNPQAPTDQQRQMLEKAKAVSASVHSCPAMEEANKAANSPRPADPGEIRLEGVNPPAFRQLLASLPPERASQPLVSGDGIAVIIVCSRDQKDLSHSSKEEVAQQLLNQRIELVSRQLQRDLQRRAIIDQRKTQTASRP